jgi:hypothetical protein
MGAMRGSCLEDISRFDVNRAYRVMRCIGQFSCNFTDVYMPKCSKHVKNVHESINKGEVCLCTKEEQERFDQQM